MKHTSKEPLKKPLWIALACVAAVAVIALCLGFFWLRGLFAAGNASPVYVESVANITGVNVGDTPRYSGVVEPQETYSIQRTNPRPLRRCTSPKATKFPLGTPCSATIPRKCR